MRNKRILTLGITGVLLLGCTTAPTVASNHSDNKNQTFVGAAHRAALSASRSYSRSALVKYANARSLTDRQLVELLKAVGFRGEGLRTAWAVAKAESNGRPYAFNGNRSTGDNSFGLFQINMIGDLGPDRRERYDLRNNNQLFDPVTNAQIAFKMTQGGTNWKSWKYAQTDAVLRWIPKFPGN